MNATSPQSLEVICNSLNLLNYYAIIIYSLFLVCVIIKLLFNYKFLLSNQLFFGYYVSLVIGAALNIVGFAYFMVELRNPTTGFTPTVIYRVSVFLSLGNIFIDIFLGLVPNFFFTLIKSELSLDFNKMTKKYFIMNLSVSMFCIISIIGFEIGMPNSIASNVILMCQIVYSWVFYGLVWRLFAFQSKFVRKKLLAYFVIYSVYAVSSIVLLVFRCINLMYPTLENTNNGILSTFVSISINMVVLLELLEKTEFYKKKTPPSFTSQ